MSEKEPKRVDDAQARKEPSDEGGAAGTKKGHPSFLPKGQVSSDTWRPPAQPTSPAARRTAQSDTASGRNPADAPNYRSGPARTQGRPASAPGTARPPAPPPETQAPGPAATGRRKSPPPLARPQPDAGSAGATRKRTAGTVEPRAGRPQPLPDGGGAAARARPAPGGPAWAGSGGAGPTAGAAGWGEPAAARRPISIARPGDGPLAGAATWWDGQSWWARSDAKTKPAEKATWAGESWWVPAEPQQPSAWAKKGPALPAYLKPFAKVDIRPPAVLQRGPALPVYLRPVAKVDTRPPAVLRKGAVQIAVFKPVVHTGPPRPFYLGGPARPFYLQPPGKGLWIFQPGAGFWVREKTKKGETKAASRQKATSDASAEPQAPPAATNFPWNTRGFVEVAADTVPASSPAFPAQAYPFLRKNDRARAAEAGAAAAEYPRVGNIPTSWTTAGETTKAKGKTAPSLDSRAPGYAAEAAAETKKASTVADLAVQNPRTPPPLVIGGARARVRDTPPPDRESGQAASGAFAEGVDAHVMQPRSKTQEAYLARIRLNPNKPVSPEYAPPSPLYSAFGYLMQNALLKEMLGIDFITPYIANNTVLQEAIPRFQALYDADTLRTGAPSLIHPTMEDILNSMGYAAKHAARYYKRQQREMGYFGEARIFPEVGLLHDARRHLAARTLINSMLQEKILDPMGLVYLAGLAPHQIDESVWEHVLIKEFRQDMALRQSLRTVTQSATVYTEREDGGETYYILESDNFRPDIFELVTKTKKLPPGDDMPWLLDGIEQIIRGPNIRRNLQDFDRWMNEKVKYKGGRKIPAFEILDLFSKRYAAGDVIGFVKEIKFHLDKLHEVHGGVKDAMGHKAASGSNIRGTSLGADIGTTLRGLLNFLKNTVIPDRKTLNAIVANTHGEFGEFALNAVREGTPDPKHLSVHDVGLPVPMWRAHVASARDLAYSMRARRRRIRADGREDLKHRTINIHYHSQQRDLTEDDTPASET